MSAIRKPRLLEVQGPSSEKRHGTVVLHLPPGQALSGVCWRVSSLGVASPWPRPPMGQAEHLPGSSFCFPNCDIKKNNYQSVERHSKTTGHKGHQLLDKTNLENVSAKRSRQAPVLQTYKDSRRGANTKAVKQSSCPIPGFSWDSERNDKDSWSQLFTEDSQGQRVIAHNSRAPFRDVTNDQNQGYGRVPNSLWAQCQDRTTQFNLQPDSLFTQDSEGNQVIRHQA